jgi:gas vesicle protein
MRFFLGLLIGLGFGFAVAILFAPEKPKKEEMPAGGSLGRPASSMSTNGHGGFKSVFESIRKNLDEAMTEAKKAQKEAEAEMTERYRQVIARSRK